MNEKSTKIIGVGFGGIKAGNTTFSIILARYFAYKKGMNVGIFDFNTENFFLYNMYLHEKKWIENNPEFMKGYPSDEGKKGSICVYKNTEYSEEKKKEFDIVILDLPSKFITTNDLYFITICDKIFIPTELTLTSFESISRMMESLIKIKMADENKLLNISPKKFIYLATMIPRGVRKRDSLKVVSILLSYYSCKLMSNRLSYFSLLRVQRNNIEKPEYLTINIPEEVSIREESYLEMKSQIQAICEEAEKLTNNEDVD